MKNELCLLSTVYVLLLLIRSEHTAALRVYRNNEYEVSDIDRRIEIPRPAISPHKPHSHSSIKRQQITLIEQTPHNRQHHISIKRHQREHPPLINKILPEHPPLIHHQSQQIGSRRQNIIHAANENNAKRVSTGYVSPMHHQSQQIGLRRQNIIHAVNENNAKRVPAEYASNTHHQPEHIGLRRQEIIHALNEDNDKIDSEDDIESLGRRIDESGNEIKDPIKPEPTSVPDKHTVAATKYIISKIKEIQDKLFKRTGSKDLEDKLNQMAPSPVINLKDKNESLPNVSNTTMNTITKNNTPPVISRSENQEANNTKLEDASKPKDGSIKPLTDDSKLKDGSVKPLADASKPKDASVKPLTDVSKPKDGDLKPVVDASKPKDGSTKTLADGSKIPDRRKIIPEEVVDKILEKFQQLKQEAKHIVSESRHSVEHAETEGKGVVYDDDSQSYEQATDPFNLPLSSIQSAGTNNSADIQIPLKVFRGKIESGNRTAIIGVPILYVKNKYYLVPAFGAVSSNPVQADVRTLNRFPGQYTKKKKQLNFPVSNLTHFAGQTGNNIPTDLPRKILQETTPRKSSVDLFTRNYSIVERLSQNPRPTETQMYESTLLSGNTERAVEGYDEPCNTNSREINQISGNICGASTVRRKDQLLPTIGRHMEHGYIGGSTNNSQIASERSPHTLANVIVRLGKSQDLLPTGKLNNIKYDNKQVRIKRQNRFVNQQPMASIARSKYMRYTDPLASIGGSITDTQSLVNKLVNTPDFPSVAEELRLARSKEELNTMQGFRHNLPTASSKTVPGNRRTFFNLNSFPHADESQGYEEKPQLSERDGLREGARHFQANEDTFQTLGESKDLASSLNNFLEGNDKRNDDTISDIDTERRSYNEEMPYRSNNDQSFTTYPSTGDTRSFMSQQNDYNTQERTSMMDTHQNNDAPYFDPDGPLPENVKNVHDMSMEDVNRPFSKNYEATSPEAIHFGLQENLASSSNTGDVSMLADDSVLNSPTNNDNVEHGAEMIHGFHHLKEYDTDRQSHTSPNTHSVEEIIDQIAQRTLHDNPIGNPYAERNEHLRESTPDVSSSYSSPNDIHKEELETESFPSERHRNAYPENSEQSMEFTRDHPSVDEKSSSIYNDNKMIDRQMEPAKLSSNIDRIQQETMQMEKEYEMLANNDRNIAGTTIEKNQLHRLHQNSPIFSFEYNNFHRKDDGMERSAEAAELLKAKQLFEVNKLAGKEDLSPMPKFNGNPDTLLDKTPDELLEYARQNSLQNSPYGVGAPGLNYDGNNLFKSSSKMPLSEIGVARSPHIDATELLHHFSDVASPLSMNLRRQDYRDNLGGYAGTNYHHPAEYLAHILRNINEESRANNDVNMKIKALQEYERAKSGEQFANMHTRVAYDEEPSLAEGFRNKKLMPSYADLAAAKDEILHRQLPPGSLAAVSVGGLSNVRFVPSNVNSYNSGMITDNPEIFPRQDFQFRNPYDRTRIPRPGKNITSYNMTLLNMTSFNMTSSNMTSSNMTSLRKYIFNITQDKNSNMTSKSESYNQSDAVENQLDEVENQFNTIYQPKDNITNDMVPYRKPGMSYNESWGKPRIVNSLLLVKNNDRLNATNIRKTNRIYDNNVSHGTNIHSKVHKQKQLIDEPYINKTINKLTNTNVNNTGTDNSTVHIL